MMQFRKKNLECSCPNCQVTIAGGKKIVDSKGNRLHICHLENCGKSFPAASLLVIHSRVHSGERPYSCEKCHKKFTQKSGLRSHMLVHTGEKKYACDVCDYRSSLNGNLKTHKKIHEKKNKISSPNDVGVNKIASPKTCYTCRYEKCTEIFESSDSLVKHLKTHTEERPYTCDWADCKDSFTRKSSLNAHKLKHTSEKKYLCNFCNYEASGNDELTLHIKNHEKKSFDERLVKSPSNSEPELKRRIKDRSYVCEWPGCLRRCSQRELFRRHMLKHTGEKNYKCDICNRRFAMRAHLKNHVKTHGRNVKKNLVDCELQEENLTSKNNLKDQREDQCSFKSKSHSQKHVIETHDKKLSKESIAQAVEPTVADLSRFSSKVTKIKVEVDPSEDLMIIYDRKRDQEQQSLLYKQNQMQLNELKYLNRLPNDSKESNSVEDIDIEEHDVKFEANQESEQPLSIINHDYYYLQFLK